MLKQLRNQGSLLIMWQDLKETKRTMINLEKALMFILGGRGRALTGWIKFELAEALEEASG